MWHLPAQTNSPASSNENKNTEKGRCMGWAYRLKTTIPLVAFWIPVIYECHQIEAWLHSFAFEKLQMQKEQ